MSAALHGVSDRQLAALIAGVSRVGSRTGRVVSHEVAGITLRVFAKAKDIMLMGDGWAMRFHSLTSRPRGRLAGALLRGERRFVGAVRVWDGQASVERWLVVPGDLIGEDDFVHQMTLVKMFGSDWGIDPA